MSAKSDAKDALAKEVNNVNIDIIPFFGDVLMTQNRDLVSYL